MNFTIVQRIVNESSSATSITLLPKKTSISRIVNFRLISLVINLNKIIVQMFSQHLRAILHENISSMREAFMEGRQILDMVLIVNKKLDKSETGR